MKKTLILIAAKAGMATLSQAASLAGQWDDFNNLTSNTLTINNATAGDTLPITSKTGGPSISETGLFLRYNDGTNGGTSRVAGAVTMTISGLTAPSTGFTTLFNIDLNGNGATWGICLGSDGKFYGSWANQKWTSGDNKGWDVSAIPDFDLNSFTLTATLGTAGTTFYINGTQIGSVLGGLKTGNVAANADTLYIGGASNGTNWQTPSFTVDHLYIDSGEMSAAEVLARYEYIQALSIPEPTSATLGLLGLAGLMIRRRRA